MGSTVLLCLGITPWIISSVCSVSLPEISNNSFISECVREHNRARSSVRPPAGDMLYMTWDEGLAITARAWARHCVFKHNIYLKDARRVHPVFSSVGENIWVGAPPSTFTAAGAIQNWVDEKNDYNYNDRSCTNICGHYTQVVWASSYKVGCAVELCPNGIDKFTALEGAIFVCNYAPAGNIIGRWPYDSQKAACSGCNGDCEDKLCRNRERDSQKSYSWTPDWDPVQSGSNYATILIVRPIALIFTFITAYIVHYFYPEIFCYE